MNKTNQKLKKQNGIYYTEGNPFELTPFIDWMNENNIGQKKVLEPFAGENNIIKSLRTSNYAKHFESFDINPGLNKDVYKKDTIKDFPKGFELIITNPPWLAKNSAKRNNIPFPETNYDDLYKHCLELCLMNGKYIAILIPATFLNNNKLKERLNKFIILHDKNMFNDTDNPSALALFGPNTVNDTEIYHDNKYIGKISELEKHLPDNNIDNRIIFNHPEGNIGFIAFDNTKENSIRFCKTDELEKYSIKKSTRMITKIKLPNVTNYGIVEKIITKVNQDINDFRENTMDTFLTPFKGIRKDMMYRRRMKYSLAKIFISKYA